MKICLIGPTYPYRGGISHYTTLLARHLRRAHEVKLYSFTRQYPRCLFPGRTDRDPSQRALKADCEYLLDPINPLTWFRTLTRLRADAPQVLILQWWVSYWAPTLAALASLTKALRVARVLYICHNVVPHDGHALFDSCMARLALRWGDAFIVHSQQDLERLRTLIPGAHVRRTPLPSYGVFDFEGVDREEVGQRLGIADRTVLFFGFVRPYKGLEYLVRAMPSVLERLPVHLLIVGEFWTDEAHYRGLIQDLGLQEHVTVINRYVPNEEVGLYFSAADVVVLPYAAATQSAVVQIAFCFDKPVITTAVGGLVEAVEDGVTGLLVPPRDATALADAIVRYFEDGLQECLAANIATDRVKSTFSWDRLVALIEELSN